MALEVLWLILALLGSFLSGSIPYSVIIGRLSTGKDLRNFNIGNPGGFNAVMTYGLPIGMTVIFIDIMKGFVPIALIDWGFKELYTVDSIWYQLAVHPWTCFMHSRAQSFTVFKIQRWTRFCGIYWYTFLG